MKMNKHIETIKHYGSATKSAALENCENTIEAVQSIGQGLLILLKVICDISLRLFFLILIIVALPFVTWLRLKAEKDYKEAVEKAKREYMERMTCLHKERDEDDKS